MAKRGKKHTNWSDAMPKPVYGVWTETSSGGYELKTAELTIIVHKFIRLGDSWFVSCYTIGVHCSDLQTDLVNLAKDRAITLVRNKLTNMLDGLSGVRLWFDTNPEDE